MEDAVFSVSLKGSGSNMRCARVRPKEVIVRPPTRGEAGERGVIPWERASGWGNHAVKEKYINNSEGHNTNRCLLAK